MSFSHSSPVIFAINKPVGPSSFAMISQLRQATGIKKIGHAGTLDPLASGVLVVGITRCGTAQLTRLVIHEKEYQAVIRLGITSQTEDGEGPLTTHPIKKPPTLATIQSVVAEFIGQINQVPPIYSALKIHGQSACRRVRKGETVNLPARSVEIKKIDILSYAWPDLSLQVTTGPGVYIRSLARDLGQKLGTGGYLAALCRTRVGDFTLAETKTVAEIGAIFKTA